MRVTVRVAEDLKLDVSRPAEIAFEQDVVVAERGERLAPRGVERLAERGDVADHAHSAAAAAGAGFDQQRRADLLRLRRESIVRLIVAVVAGNDRDAAFAHAPLAFDLVAHRLDRGRRRAHEDHAGLARRHARTARVRTGNRSPDGARRRAACARRR